ncbi:MAG: DUF1929 domain-containing protein [Candidatus Eisenbacteria bacterium]|nr:DUF1929 domain-containing protein [Candidatus Eisenbacteria bacterium]
MPFAKGGRHGPVSKKFPNLTPPPPAHPIPLGLLIVALAWFPPLAHASFDQTGAWSNVIDWSESALPNTFFPSGVYEPRSLIAIHAVNLPDANATGHQALLWGVNFKCEGGLRQTRALYFDQDFTPPPFGTSTGHGLSLPASDPTDWLLCAGHAFSHSGELITVGGEVQYTHFLAGYACQPHIDCPEGDLDGFNEGIRKIFSFGGGWAERTQMWKKRWYPTPVRLADGRLYIGGGDSIAVCSRTPQPLPDFYLRERDFTSVSPEPVKGIEENYPMLFPAPRGGVFYATNTPKVMAATTQEWKEFQREELIGDEGSAVAYAGFKVLRTGGYRAFLADNGVERAKKNSWVADMTAYLNSPTASITWTPAADMNEVRAQHNLVVLPTGRVVAFGGSCGDTSDPDATGCPAQLTPEMWDPELPGIAWVPLAPMTQRRSYHSTALLLYDGRVLVAGGGFVPDRPDFPNAEIFYPPYLFRGPNATAPLTDAERAVCLNTPALTAVYGQPFAVKYNGPQPATGAALVGVGATTHHFDPNQRRVGIPVLGNLQDPVTQLRTATLQAPVLPDSVPPGKYMVFLWHLENSNPVMGKAAYVTITDGKALATAGKAWASVGTPLQGAGSASHWAKLTLQEDNQRFGLNTATGGAPNGLMNVTGVLPVPTSGISVHTVDLYVQHSATAKTANHFPAYSLPSLKVRAWAYTNSTANDTTGTWWQMGASTYTTGIVDHEIMTIPTNTSSIVPLRWVKFMDPVGLADYYELKMQVEWSHPTSNVDPAGYELRVDDVHWRIRYTVPPS